MARRTVSFVYCKVPAVKFRRTVRARVLLRRSARCQAASRGGGVVDVDRQCRRHEPQRNCNKKIEDGLDQAHAVCIMSHTTTFLYHRKGG